jgi:integrase
VTKIRLQFVQGFVDRHGQPRFYFRRRGSARVALPGLPGSAEFMAAYQVALTAMPLPVGADKRSKPGSISLALAGYFDSLPFRDLSNGTRVSRRCILERFRDQHGHLPLASLPPEFLHALLDSMSRHQARNFLKAVRGFIKWCLDRKLIGRDPTLGIKVRLPKSDGYHTWTEDEIAAFEARHTVGSKARLAFALGLYTAQRRSDVVRIGRQHIRDGVLTVRQQKTGAVLAIPVHPDLAAIIAATSTSIGHLSLLTTKRGKSYDANVFSQEFRKWCSHAGLPEHCTFHGLRKAACTRLADAGCTVHEIAAISGHKSLAEVERYTRKADQQRLARMALERITNTGVKPEPTGVSNPLDRLPKKAG